MVGRERQQAAGKAVIAGPVIAGTAMAGLVFIAGCGSSPRDEYMRIRSITIAPESGDGSTVASLNFATPTAMGTTDNSLVMSADATTDMPQQ